MQYIKFSFFVLSVPHSRDRRNTLYSYARVPFFLCLTYTFTREQLDSLFLCCSLAHALRAPDRRNLIIHVRCNSARRPPSILVTSPHLMFYTRNTRNTASKHVTQNQLERLNCFRRPMYLLWSSQPWRTSRRELFKFSTLCSFSDKPYSRRSGLINSSRELARTNSNVLTRHNLRPILR